MNEGFKEGDVIGSVVYKGRGKPSASKYIDSEDLVEIERNEANEKDLFNIRAIMVNWAKSEIGNEEALCDIATIISKREK